MIEILFLLFEFIPLALAYVWIYKKYKGKFLIGDKLFLIENLIIITFFGSIIGLYLNNLVYDFIDHHFNLHSIVFGLISTAILVLAYRTKHTKLLITLDFFLWFVVLTIKGGYNVGFGVGIPYPSIIVFDLISTLLRLQIFRKYIYDFKWQLLVLLTIIIFIFKICFFSYPMY
jgi:hypothetical protein